MSEEVKSSEEGIRKDLEKQITLHVCEFMLCWYVTMARHR